MGFGLTVKDGGGLPISCVYVQGYGFLPLMGTPQAAVDANGNLSTTAVMTIGGPQATDPYFATVFPTGYVGVQEAEAQLFQDGFDTSTLDITNRWKAPTAAGGGVAASNALTNTVLGTGTTISGYSYLESVPPFPPTNPGWLLFYAGINLQFPLIANTYFFWGIGTSPATPTAALPLTNACGFEVSTSGKMYAVTYQSGTRVQVADLSSSGNNKQPLDANVHKYYVYYRGDNIYWCIDGNTAVVASTTTGAPGPDVNILPIKFTAIAGAVAPLSNGTLQVNTVTMSDTARNNFQIADKDFPWRQVLVDSLGGLRTAGCSATAIAGGAAGPTVIKATPGTFYGAVVTATAALALNVFDNASVASGKLVGVTIGSPPVATYITVPANGVNCTNGITVLGGATMPAMTIFWS